MKTQIVAGIAALSCAVAGPAVAAAASVPKLPSDYIVPNKSLGGLKLNAPAATATKIFGAKACTSGGCSYTGPNQSWNLSVIFAAKTATSKPYIGEINFMVTKPSSSVPELRTANGITIGSSGAALKKAYPHLLGTPAGSLYTSTKLPLTVYSFTNGHLVGISMRSVALG